MVLDNVNGDIQKKLLEEKDGFSLLEATFFRFSKVKQTVFKPYLKWGKLLPRYLFVQKRKCGHFRNLHTQASKMQLQLNCFLRKFFLMFLSGDWNLIFCDLEKSFSRVLAYLLPYFLLLWFTEFFSKKVDPARHTRSCCTRLVNYFVTLIQMYILPCKKLFKFVKNCNRY